MDASLNKPVSGFNSALAELDKILQQIVDDNLDDSNTNETASPEHKDVIVGDPCLITESNIKSERDAVISGCSANVGAVVNHFSFQINFFST